MSLWYWDPVLERRRCVAWISFASALLDVLLLEQQDNNSADSCDCAAYSITSTDASSDGFSVMVLDDTIDEASQRAAAIFSDLEGSLEDFLTRRGAAVLALP
jgi:hypothetical protein